jgi:hypothetical protein
MSSDEIEQQLTELDSQLRFIEVRVAELEAEKDRRNMFKE